jgi:hypothetical protein
MADPVAAGTVRPSDVSRTGGVPTPQVANFDSASIRALSPEARESFAAALAKGGYTEAQVRAALSGTQTGTPAPPSPAADTVDLTKTSGEPLLSKSETAQAATFWQGLPPEGYDLRSTFVGKGLDFSTAQILNSAFRTAFSSMELPAALGPGIADAMLQASARYEAPQSEPARRLANATTRSDVEQITGKSFSEVMAAVAPMLNRIPRTPDTAMLIERGLLTSSAVVVQLYRHAERQATRKST